MSDEKLMGQVIQIDEARIRDHLGEMVRGTVEETLNAMLDAEADQLCGAGRYERSQTRQDTRAGSYERTLQTSAGDVNLKIPKLRRQTFETKTAIYSELKNVCVWNKTNAGMGSLYRSKHELIFVFKNGNCPHINNIGLGRHGRHRANVWDYSGQNAMDRSSKSKLALHPTVKPVALVMDAIRDCSNRSGIVLDPFGGIGTTLIAAEKAGRKARLIEIDPCYVDTTIKRWQRLTGRTALRADTQRSFQDLQLEAARLPECAPDPAS